MPIYASKRVLYRLGAVAAVPVSAYNLVVGFSDMDALPEHAKSLTGGFALIVVAIVLIVLSFTRPDRQIKICC